MNTTTITKLTIEIEGDDIKNLKTGLKKLCAEVTKPGFNSGVLSTEETDVIKKLNENLK